MPHYRKKPVPVEARQFTGDNFPELQDWGDYIVKGVRGETYEPSDKHDATTIRPTPAKTMKPDDTPDKVVDTTDNGVDPFQS